ncbi:MULTISPECIES: alpha/beta hydrolase [Clostridium]|jgi:3-oxoadipate enol-lactonase|nr:alpha/beta hydrolase [Clostridium sp. C8]KLE14881.1 alpha/beta hydrolase [Clostridium sp. C8]
MPFIKYNEKNIYYEVHGEGEVIVILNGIMMSHMSWKAFIPELSRNNKVVLLDFLDQGKSDKMDSLYKQDLQVEVVKAVIDKLELNKINLFGISYGGEVALQFALKYKNLLNKLILFNTTSNTNSWLQDIGRGWINAAETKDAETFYNVTIPIIYSPSFYNKNIDWMNKRREILYKVFKEDFLISMIRLIKSAEGYDVKEKLNKIDISTLIVSSEYDFITPVAEQEDIYKGIPNSQYILIRECGHASMYEKPNEFINILKGYLFVEKEIKIV